MVIRPAAARLGLILLAVGLILLASGRPTSADHNVYLPYVPNVPIMQQVIRAQEYTFCVDSRASAYPGFLSQLRDVNAEYESRVGIRAREVAFSDPSCQVQHVMLPDFPCGSGAAGCIYYGNWPVTVHYQEQLGYVDWRTTHGHELGHGLLGLHEQYADSSGGIGCLRDRTWTVMSCGTGVRYPQQIDVDRGCAVIRTAWCGNPPPPPPEWCCQQDYDSDGNADDGYLHVPTNKWYWDVLCRWEWSDANPTWTPEKGCP